AHRPDDVVQLVVALLLDGVGGDLRAVDAGAEEAGRGHRPGVVRSDLVAGNLLPNEPIIGLVVVEGADDEVAIGPRVRAVVVVLEAVTLGEADDVEPVPRPALSISRR